MAAYLAKGQRGASASNNERRPLMATGSGDADDADDNDYPRRKKKKNCCSFCCNSDPVYKDEAWHPGSRLWTSFILNISSSILVIVVVIIGVTMVGEDEYVRFGPEENGNLKILSVVIDTWGKWALALLFIVILAVVDVLIRDLSSTFVYNAVYNSEVGVVHRFDSECSLQLYANVMDFTTAVRRLVLVVISVTQIDLGLFTAFFVQLARIYTYGVNLRDKEYDPRPAPPHHHGSKKATLEGGVTGHWALHDSDHGQKIPLKHSVNAKGKPAARSGTARRGSPNDPSGRDV